MNGYGKYPLEGRACDGKKWPCDHHLLNATNCKWRRCSTKDPSREYFIPEFYAADKSPCCIHIAWASLWWTKPIIQTRPDGSLLDLEHSHEGSTQEKAANFNGLAAECKIINVVGSKRGLSFMSNTRMSRSIGLYYDIEGSNPTNFPKVSNVIY